MIVERTLYFAKPGRAPEVLDARRRASGIRRGLGLPAGAIHTRHGDSDAPDVSWECRFRSEEEHQTDLATRDESEEFSAIRREIQQLVARFERHVTIQEEGDLDLDGLSLRPDEHRFASPNGELKGFLYLPPGDGPHPAVVLNHGSGVTQDSSDISKPSVASILLGWGVACFFPNRWGYGLSPGRYWTQDVSSPFGTADYDRQLVTRLHRESLDVVGAFDYLRTLRQIDAEHIGVMGSSFGGTVSLLAAAECDRFRCAIDFAGAAMNWESTPRLREIMEKAARALEMPIFLIQAENDYSTKPTTDLARLLEGEGKTYQARVYPPFGVTHDEGHFFERAGAAVWGYDVKRFLERYL